MAVATEGTTAHVPHVPDLAVFVAQARVAGAATDGEALGLVQASLQLLAEQWSDGVRIRLVAGAPVDVARWLVPPRRPAGEAVPGADIAELAAALADHTGQPLTICRRVLEAVVRALAELLPVEARPPGFSRPR